MGCSGEAVNSADACGLDLSGSGASRRAFLAGLCDY